MTFQAQISQGIRDENVETRTELPTSKTTNNQKQRRKKGKQVSGGRLHFQTELEWQANNITLLLMVLQTLRVFVSIFSHLLRVQCNASDGTQR